MIHIRTKMFIYFMAIILIMIVGTIFLQINSQKTIHRYTESFESFLILNEISQLTIQTYDTLNLYLTERDPEYLAKYEVYRDELKRYQDKLTGKLESESNSLIIQNHENMIGSFLEECELTILAFEAGQVDFYSYHINESLKISQYIHENTLSLVNSDLTEYQLFFNKMTERDQAYFWMVVYALLTIFFLSLFLTDWFSRGVTKPVSKLSKAAIEISKGNFDIEDVTINTKDEMEVLANAFNQMRNNIQNLVEEIKQKSELDKLLKELELKTLQSQINPHFLFNTLNTISRTAYIEDAEKTVELIESISTLLRYNLGNLEKPVLLKDEVNIVKEYLFIQETRFGDRVTFVLEIDETCLDIKIPSLTLQPIVENAFIHGIESVEEAAEIKLIIRKDMTNIIVEIRDNGCGMAEETIERILNESEHSKEIKEIVAQKKKGHSTGLGLANVIKRLRLFFQKDDLFSIYSKVGEGTSVYLKLPNKRGELYESNDRR
ncbi:histidine kinase [Salipaludibacillus neizhouensis]|uniref:histidine kinase n=1 Tax=Salipaludibacillus neizhouensis TaxID=885475 RepID=A0A3A9K3G1_9BACI|nr:histidine kinase [Salipaludibacillus neizhouensis]RKL65410.1 histidine kinase [Salipaludibacillus neizhouensis]